VYAFQDADASAVVLCQGVLVALAHTFASRHLHVLSNGLLD